MPHSERDLAAPAVPPERYDEDYYRTCCAGAAEWSASGGREAADLYAGVLKLADLRPGEVVVDIGTGRGELVAVAVELGAQRAIGVDYSDSAIELARETLRVRGVDEEAEVRLADARQLPVDDAVADLAMMIDVVEHLSPDELDAALAETLRVLQPGGRLFIHTMPNRTLYEVTYRVHRIAMRLLGRRWPADPRNDYERAMHVNEQTATSLRRVLRRAGFERVTIELGRATYTGFLPDPRHARLYRLLARVPATRRLGAVDLFATAYRPES